jgi:hypothetical protein
MPAVIDDAGMVMVGVVGFADHRYRTGRRRRGSIVRVRVHEAPRSRWACATITNEHIIEQLAYAPQTDGAVPVIEGHQRLLAQGRNLSDTRRLGSRCRARQGRSLVTSRHCQPPLRGRARSRGIPAA